MFQSHAVREAAATVQGDLAEAAPLACFNPMQLGKPLRPIKLAYGSTTAEFQSHAVREAAATGYIA